MNQIRLILQMHIGGLSERSIARTMSVSRNTVSSYVTLFKQSSYSLEALYAMNDTDLGEVCHFPRGTASPDARYLVIKQNLDEWMGELTNPKVTRRLLWEEYRQKHPDGYGYTQFCNHIKERQAHRNVTAVFRHGAGEQLMADFAGSSLYYHDPRTHRSVKCEVFVAVLPFSGLMFCMAIPSQKQEYFIEAVGRALEYIGGVPSSILYDNARNAVRKADRYEPVFTELIEQLSLHYRTTFMATRVKSPRDKPHVEGAVRIAYNRIYARMRHEVFTSLEQINMRIAVLLDSLNTRALHGKGYSRRDLFERKEKALLRPLPAESFEVKRTIRAKVQRNYHVMLGEDKHFYSVPYSYVSKSVTAIYTLHTVEIYAGHKRIAFHRRERRQWGYTTSKDHMPSNHRAVHTQRGYNKEYFLSWAQRIGPNTHAAISMVLSRKVFIEQSYKSCLGILRLAEKHTPQRLETAAHMALELRGVTYHRLKDILANGMDKQDESLQRDFTTPEHDNIRGTQHYQDLFFNPK